MVLLLLCRFTAIYLLQVTRGVFCRSLDTCVHIFVSLHNTDIIMMWRSHLESVLYNLTRPPYSPDVFSWNLLTCVLINFAIADSVPLKDNVHSNFFIIFYDMHVVTNFGLIFHHWMFLDNLEMKQLINNETFDECFFVLVYRLLVTFHLKKITKNC